MNIDIIILDGESTVAKFAQASGLSEKKVRKLLQEDLAANRIRYLTIATDS